MCQVQYLVLSSVDWLYGEDGIWDRISKKKRELN